VQDSDQHLCNGCKDCRGFRSRSYSAGFRYIGS
jgi:hypothetical protein